MIGLGDVWEQQNGLAIGPNEAALDLDGDGDQQLARVPRRHRPARPLNSRLRFDSVTKANGVSDAENSLARAGRDCTGMQQERGCVGVADHRDRTAEGRGPSGDAHRSGAAAQAVLPAGTFVAVKATPFDAWNERPPWRVMPVWNISRRIPNCLKLEFQAPERGVSNRRCDE
jgi:hypothetical protein